jgi:hypothetical protein
MWDHKRREWPGEAGPALLAGRLRTIHVHLRDYKHQDGKVV